MRSRHSLSTVLGWPVSNLVEKGLLSGFARGRGLDGEIAFVIDVPAGRVRPLRTLPCTQEGLDGGTNSWPDRQLAEAALAAGSHIADRVARPAGHRERAG